MQNAQFFFYYYICGAVLVGFLSAWYEARVNQACDLNTICINVFTNTILAPYVILKVLWWMIRKLTDGILLVLELLFELAS